MSKFSEQLAKYMDEKKMTVMTLSKIAGLERTYLHKLKKGNFSPKDISIVQSLASALMLSPSEEDLLLDAYKISKIGEDVYYKRQSVQNFILSFQDLLLDISLPDNLQIDPIVADPNTTAIYGSNNIYKMLTYIVSEEINRKNSEINILVQPDFSFLFDYFNVLPIPNDSTAITLIIGLDSSNTQNRDDYNLNCLKKITNLLSLKCKFEALYYYSELQTKPQISNLFPYIILTTKSVLCISQDLHQSLLLSTPEQITLYAKCFETVKKKCHVFIQQLGSPLDHVLHYMSLDGLLKRVDHTYSLMPEPAMTFFLSKQMLNKYLKPDFFQQELLQNIIDHKDNQISFLQNNTIVSYFTKKGIEQFLTTGRITELPNVFYTPIAPLDCYKLLQQVYEAAIAGNYQPILVNTNQFDVPSNLLLGSYNNNMVSFIYSNRKENYYSFSLKEMTLSNIIFEFLVYLKDSELVYSIQDTILYLEQILKEKKYL